MILDSIGTPITIPRLRALTLQQTMDLFGEDGEARLLTSPAGTVTLRCWNLTGGATIERVDLPPRYGSAIGMFLPAVYPFHLSTALEWAGLPAEYPADPTHTHDGVVRWAFWPEYGCIAINYPLHSVLAMDAAPRGGGSFDFIKFLNAA